MNWFSRWLNNTSFTEPGERQQAVLFQTIMMIGTVVVGFSTIFDFFDGSSQITLALTFTGDLVIMLACMSSIVVVRRGYLQGGALVGSLVALAGIVLYLIPGGITHSGGYTLALTPVITLAGLLAGRRALVGVLVAMLVLVVLLTALESLAPTLVGFEPRETSRQAIMITIIVSLLLNAFFLDRFGLRLQDALRLARRNQALAEQSLQWVKEQAQELSAKNARLEQAERTLRDLVATLETPSVPLARGVLLAPLVGVIDSTRAQRITTRLLHEASAQRAAVIVLDIAGVVQVDLAVARALVETAMALRLLGCRVVISGIPPAVATTLTALGIAFDDLEIMRSPQDVLEQIYPHAADAL